MEDKITLDKTAFKALASDTRISILKSLKVRRKTLSELSKQFDMSVSTIKEHLDNLSEAGLVVQMDEGHKWKYYELTGKGEAIFEPYDNRIWILLSISAVALAVTGFDFGIRSLSFGSYMAPTVMQNVADNAPVLGAEKAVGDAAAAAAQPGLFPWLHIALAAVFLIIILILLAKIVMGRKRRLIKPS